MTPFWQFTKMMLRDRGRLITAMAFAFFAALGLGAGLMTLLPMFEIVLSQEETLQGLAIDYNAGSPIIAIPGWLVNQLPTDPYAGVIWLTGFIAVLTVMGSVANFLHQYLSLTVTTKTVALIRLDAFHHVVHLPLGRVISRGPSEFIARIVRDCAELQRGFIALTSKAVAQLSKGFAALVVALIVQPGLTLAFIVLAPVLAVVLRKLGKRIRRGTRGALAAQEQLLRIATETLQGLRAVKANTAERRATKRFHQYNKEVVYQELRARTARAFSAPLVEMLAIFALGGLAVIAAKQILGGDLQMERFMVALGALAVAGASFRPLAGLVNEIQAAAAPAERLAEILDEIHEREIGYRPPALPRHHNSIVFENISLTYPNSEHPALEHVSFEIAHGERVAIVGPNGSGKTTLLSLLPRLLRPDAGRILIDGTDIATVSLRSLRSQIAVVTQESVLFRGSIADNIAYGATGATRDEILAAAKRAHAEQFILNIPGGYDADVLEQGASLSGGQRQRLVIARAILREPAILILDEATSQVDADSEAHINAALDEFCDGRTGLVIAHRMSTVLRADRIVVLDQGHIIDQGTHDELMDRCPLYRRLMQHQMYDGGKSETTPTRTVVRARRTYRHRPPNSPSE